MPQIKLGNSYRLVNAVAAAFDLAGVNVTPEFRARAAEFVRKEIYAHNAGLDALLATVTGADDEDDEDDEDDDGAFEPGYDRDDYDYDDGDGDAPPVRWEAHVAIDPTTGAPTVKGTWVTVDQVVGEIVAGESWSDVLRSHPELSEDDIRACLAYETAHDGVEGRL